MFSPINTGLYPSFLAVLITLPANSTLEQLSGRHYLICRLTTPTGSIIDANTPPIKMVDIIYKAYVGKYRGFNKLTNCGDK